MQIFPKNSTLVKIRGLTFWPHFAEMSGKKQQRGQIIRASSDFGFWAWVGILNYLLSGSKFTKLSKLNLFVQLLCMRPCWACKKIGPGLLAYVLQPQNKARAYELRPRPVPALDQNQHWFRWTFLTANQMLHKFHSCLERANFRLPSPRLQLSWGQVRPSWSQVRMQEWQNRCPHDVWKINGD